MNQTGFLVSAVVGRLFVKEDIDGLPHAELLLLLTYSTYSEGDSDHSRPLIEQGLPIQPLDPSGLSEKTLIALEARGFRFIGRCT